jgi:acyl carrier protein
LVGARCQQRKQRPGEFLRARAGARVTINDDFAATSLDRVEVVMALEDEFAINIYDDQAAELRTVGDLVACVATSLRRRPPVSAP